MQARVISGSGADFNTLVFGAPSKSTVRYIQERTDEYIRAGSGQARRLKDSILDLVNSYVGDDAMRRARSLVRRADAVFVPDDIRLLETIGQLQQAKSKMQRWVMSSPMLRELAHRQRIEGYHDTYTDTDVGKWGSWHRDYQLVIDGQIMDDPDNEELEIFETWIEPIDNDDDDLDLIDQLDIQTTITLAEIKVAEGGEDPTSRTNALL